MKNKSKVQGLEHYSEDELRGFVRGHFEGCTPMFDADVRAYGIALYGSRTKGTARADSDLDAAVEYIGNVREDDMFSILNDDPLYVDGTIQVDINPVPR